MRNREYSHPSLSAFAQIAEALASLATDEERAPAALLAALHELLARACAAALQLPPTSTLFDETDSPGDELESPRSPPATEVSAPAGLQRLAAFLGSRRYYREVFDPYSKPSDVEVTGDLIDDLCDIHRDLTIGLSNWNAGNSGEALWQWRSSFETHWGEHATSALRALFALCAWHDVPWPEAEE